LQVEKCDNLVGNKNMLTGFYITGAISGGISGFNSFVNE
jgi:hypothetical protein